MVITTSGRAPTMSGVQEPTTPPGEELEPELGPRQAALIDAITTRLWSGLPLSDADLEAMVWVAHVLGLGQYMDPSTRAASDGSPLEVAGG